MSEIAQGRETLERTYRDAKSREVASNAALLPRAGEWHGRGVMVSSCAELGIVKSEETEVANIRPEQHLRLVGHIARRFIGRGVSSDDLLAEGNLALLRAIRRFDPVRGVCFSTYAGRAINNALAMLINRELDHHRRIKCVDVSLLACMPQETRASTWPRHPRLAAPGLTAREWDVISAYYGIGRPAETLGDIGKRWGITKQAVFLVKKKALRKLGESRDFAA